MMMCYVITEHFSVNNVVAISFINSLGPRSGEVLIGRMFNYVVK
jgi:hypothetical protein